MQNKKNNQFEKDMQEVYSKASQLMNHGNKEYAQELFKLCLGKDPEFADARNKLRSIQVKNKSTSFDKFISKIKFQIDSISIDKLVKDGNVAQALMIIEDALCKDYNNKQVFVKLIQVAKKSDYPELVKETLEYAVAQFTSDFKLRFSLADAYIKVGLSKNAVDIMHELLKTKPNNLVYQRKLKEANAVQIIDEKKWESEN